MFTVVAPASMTAATTSARYAGSVREASSAENSTSEQKASREPHRFHGAADDFLLRHVQLVRAVNLAGRDEHVDPRPLGRLHCLPGALDVVRVATREAADDRAANLAWRSPGRIRNPPARPPEIRPRSHRHAGHAGRQRHAASPAASCCTRGPARRPAAWCRKLSRDCWLPDSWLTSSCHVAAIVPARTCPAVRGRLVTCPR